MIRSQGERKLGEWWPQAGERGACEGEAKEVIEKGEGGHRRGVCTDIRTLQCDSPGRAVSFSLPNTCIFSLRV